MNAIDSNGFQSTATAAGYINPDIWNRQVLAYLEESLIVSKFAKVYDDLLGAPGATLNVTINSTPLAASSVAESADVTISAYAVTQVIFTPSEYAFAYAISDKEARRGFYDIASDMTKKIGYALGLKREQFAVSLLQTSAGNTLNANGVVTSAIASSDTLDYADVVNLATLIRQDYLFPRALFLSAGQIGQLSKDSQFSYVNQSGSPETLRGGQIGRIYGMDVFWTTTIAPTTSKSKGIMLGVDLTGEPAFGICRKALPTIRTQRFELGRYTNIVGAEDWDMQVLRANGIGTVQTYDA